MIGAVTTQLFRTSNYIEAGLWIVIGMGFAMAAQGKSGLLRRRCWIAAVTFVLFGLSDLVEVRTGAWYRPWWLLMWKGACVMVLAWLLITYVREKRTSR
jgi:hypothetical protein